MSKQMSNRGEDCWKQSEFWFIFTNADQSHSVSDPGGEHEYTTSISEDVAKTHRDKLLAELRDFGC